MKTLPITSTTAKQNLAANVAKLMAKRGVTQVQLAIATGISQGYVCKIIAGKVLPNALTVQTIAKYFGASTDKLLDTPKK